MYPQIAPDYTSIYNICIQKQIHIVYSVVSYELYDKLKRQYSLTCTGYKALGLFFLRELPRVFNQRNVHNRITSNVQNTDFV